MQDKIDEIGDELQEHNSSLQIILYRIDKLEDTEKKELQRLLDKIETLMEENHLQKQLIAVHDTKIKDIQKELSLKVNQELYEKHEDVMDARLNTYKKVAIGIVITVTGALLLEVIHFI